MRRLSLAVVRVILGLFVVGGCLVLVALFWPRPSDARALRTMLERLPARRYDPAGRYVGPLDPSSLHPPQTALGHDGVPRVHYPGIGYQANPVTAAQFGLRAYGEWLRDRGAPEHAVVVRVADWLVRRQAQDGQMALSVRVPLPRWPGGGALGVSDGTGASDVAARARLPAHRPQHLSPRC
jgi:hypothetical protein